MSCWHRAIDRSHTQVVLLTGEAGIGKTRIADELAAVAGDAAVVVRSACPGYGSLVGTRVGSELARGLDDDGSSGATAISLDEQGVLRLRLLLSERAAQRPVLIVIDDMHNATRTDLEPLAQLVARASELRLLLLLAGRPQPADWLATFGGATTIRLEPLATEDASRLAASIAGDLPLAKDAAEQIAAESGGNPLHVRELIRLLAANDGLVIRSGQYRLGERLPLPASLHAVLSARLDALSTTDKAVLQDMAIFSGGAQVDEVSVMAGHDVTVTLERLVTSGLLRQEARGRYVVADPLLREVAYEQLPHSARGERHRRASAVAATPLGRARHLGLAAGYLTNDHDLHAEASASLASTGLDLLQTSDYRGGVELLRQAVALGNDDPPVLIRLAQAETDVGNTAEAAALLDSIDTGGDPRLEAEVLHARGNWVHADREAALEMLADAARRWEALGDQQKRAWALANRGNALFQLGRIDEAVPDIESSLAAFQRIGDRDGAAAAGQQLALVKPDDPRVPELLTEGLRFAQDAGDLVRMRNALIPLAWVRFIRSQLGGEAATEEALANAGALSRISHDIGDPAFEAQGHALAAILHRLLGHLDRAEEQMRLALRVSLPAASMAAPLLEAATFVVALARGPAVVERPAPALDPGPLAVISDALIIEALLLSGDPEAALEHLAASQLDVGPGGSPVLGRLMGVVRGAVLVFTNRHDETEESLTAARDAARAVNALPTEVAATALLAESRFWQGRREEARDLLDQIPDDPGGVAGLLRDRVRVLLGEPGLERRIQEVASALCAPGLALDITPSAG